METLKQIAWKYGESCFGSSYVKYQCDLAFREGAEFAQSWISVTEEKPTKGVEIILKNSNKKILFTPKTEDDIKWCVEKFTYWRNVEL